MSKAPSGIRRNKANLCTFTSSRNYQLREEIKDLIEKGILRHSKSPWSSPMVPVWKPDNTVCLCIDYRKLNSCTQPDPYELPLIEDLHQVGEAQYLYGS